MNGKQTHFWFFILNLSDRISDLDPDCDNYRDEVIELLQSVRTTYGNCHRPLDQFELFVVTVFCNTLSNALEKMTDAQQRTMRRAGLPLGQEPSRNQEPSRSEM